MSAAVTIREASERDLDSLVELLGVLFSIEKDFRPDVVRQRRGLELMLRPPARLPDEAAGTTVAETRREDLRLVLVAEDHEAGRVVGMATAQVVVSTAEGGPSLLVEDVVVRSEARGRGIGRALLARLAAWGEGLGATRMQLLADRTNAPAAAFYAACGFHPTNLVCLRRILPAGK